MATGLRRTSLFQRRFARPLKPVQQLGTASNIREDEEGFDNIDDFFSQEVENHKDDMVDNKIAAEVTTTKGSMMEDVLSQPVRTSTIGLKQQVNDDPAYKPEHYDYDMDYTVPVNYGSDDAGPESMEPDRMMDVDEEAEIEFSPKITLRKSTASKAQLSPLKPQAESNSAKQKTQKTAAKKPDLAKMLASPKRTVDGLRHSRRTRRAPVEYWRGESVVYGISEIGIPTVVDVVRKARSPVKPLAKRDRRSKAKESHSNKVVADVLGEAGFVPDVRVMATVMDFDDATEIERLIAISQDQHKPERAGDEQFLISTVFEEGSYLTAGILVFPPGSEKPSRNSANHALVFYVICGTFQVSVNNTTFIIGTGGQFIIPRGNPYKLKVMSDSEGKLHFCHCLDTKQILLDN